MPMARLPITLRALVLVPLLAVGTDLARATLACGPRAESCLQAAGQGWLGAAGIALLVLYALGLALGVARLAGGGHRGRGTAHGFLHQWLVGTAGVAAVCGGQALLAGALGTGGSLGGGWLELIAFCAAAGALLAFALRVAPAAAALVREWSAAPRLLASAVLADHSLALAPHRRRLLLALAAHGRAPPASRR
jgi:hypothetical protein